LNKTKFKGQMQKTKYCSK